MNEENKKLPHGHEEAAQNIKVTAIIPQFDRIPQELKDRNQWVLWKLVPDPKRDKPKKVPFQVNGREARANNPQTWSSFDKVLEVFKRGAYKGIGFVFSENDPYVGIDFDDCIEDGWAVDPGVQLLVDTLDSYTELSQSGSGLHTIVRARLQKNRTKSNKSPKEGDFAAFSSSGRYFAFTGNVWSQASEIEERQLQLDGVMAHLFPQEGGARTAAAATPDLTDEEIIQKAERAKNGAKFIKLFRDGEYEDHSASDLALLNILAFYTQDPSQIDRLFRQSALYREEKWEARGESFRQSEITKALAGLREVYRGKSETAAAKVLPFRSADFSEFGDCPEIDPEQPGLSIDKNGNVRNTNGNLRILVKTKLAPRKDVFANKFYANGRQIVDKDGVEFAADLSQDVGVEYNTTRVKEAIVSYAEEYHPVKDYLESLKWDGVERAETTFIDWLGAEDITGYTRLATRQFLKAMIKRIYEPGCEHQEILVLVGPQGIYKSNILRDLSKGWFYDSLDNPDTKIVGERTAGSWIVELQELKIFKGLNEETKKEFLSRREEKYRAAYDRFVSEYPRQFVLAGTTNRQEFLADYTGDRRYIPIQCGGQAYAISKAPWDHFPAQVDQILAEAVELYKQDNFIGIPPDRWGIFDKAREAFRFENEYLADVIAVTEREENPDRISVEWLADKIPYIHGEPDKREKALLHDAIQRMGGYCRMGKQAKIFGVNTRNGWEKYPQA